MLVIWISALLRQMPDDDNGPLSWLVSSLYQTGFFAVDSQLLNFN
jgi:hypothetical protein